MVPEQLQPEDPWSQTGITPTSSSSQLGIRYDSNKPDEPPVLDETNDMSIAMNHVDPIMSLANEFYEGDDPEEDEEDDFDLGVGQIVNFSDDEDTDDLPEMRDTSQNLNEATFHSAVSDTEDSFHSAIDQSSLLGQSRNDDSINNDTSTNNVSPYFANIRKSAQTSTPIHGNVPVQSNKRPTSPLLNPIAKKASSICEGVETRRMRMVTFTPPFRKDTENPTPSTSSNSFNQALEETRHTLSQTGIASSSPSFQGNQPSPGHSRADMEERTRQWPSWIRMFNHQNACWLNAPTNGLIWTLKSQGISSIGVPPNVPPGQWTPLDFFKHFYGLNVGAHATPQLLMQKLASRKRQQEINTDQFPAEKLFELKESIDAFYQRLCPILNIVITTKECKGCHKEEYVTEAINIEFLMSISLEDGNASSSLQTMIDNHLDSEFKSDCPACGHKDGVTRTSKIRLQDPRDGIIICLKRVEFLNDVRRKISKQVEIPDEIRLPTGEDGQYQTYVFNCSVEHLGDINGGHYKCHVQDRFGYATINDDHEVVPTNKQSVKKSSLFFYGKRRFYDPIAPDANMTNAFPSLQLDISMEVDLAEQQSLLEQLEEDQRVQTRKREEEEEKTKKAKAAASTSQSSRTSTCPMTRARVNEEGSAASVSGTAAVTLVANVTNEPASTDSTSVQEEEEVNLVAKTPTARQEKVRSQLEKLTNRQQYHLYHPKNEPRFNWLVFGMAGIISTMKKAAVDIEKPPKKNCQLLTIHELFKMVFHLSPGKIVDLSIMAQKLSQLAGRQDLATKSQSTVTLLELDVFSGEDGPWNMLVPTFIKHLEISPCNCEMRSEPYEMAEYIQHCPFQVNIPKKTPKGMKLSLQSLVDSELWLDSVSFRRCDSCKNQKVKSEGETEMYDGAKGIIIAVNHPQLPKNSKKKKTLVPIEEVITFNNHKTDPKTPPITYYKLVCGIEEGPKPQEKTFHFLSKKQVVNIANGEEMKLGGMDDFQRCQIFFFNKINEPKYHTFDELMEMDSDQSDQDFLSQHHF